MTQESRLVGTSPFAKRIAKQVARLGVGREDVLILGETGSGRRTVAWEIHNARGKKKPYVLIDARSMVSEEIHAIFTGQNPEAAEAISGRRPPTFCENATITVADADMLAPHLQALLSFFLKEGRKKVAGAKVIVTVQQPLERLAQSGQFAADLVGHLEKFDVVEVPPLRERVEDIPALTTSITKQLCTMLGKPMKDIDENPMQILSQGQWPGNLQQLVGVLGKAVMISHGDNLELPPDFLDEHQHLTDAIANIHSERSFLLDQSLDLIEKLLIQRALRHFLYNQSKTAQVFGLSEANFRYRLKKFGLPSIRKKV